MVDTVEISQFSIDSNFNTTANPTSLTSESSVVLKFIMSFCITFFIHYKWIEEKQ